jgi:hypothetical protein
VLNRRLPARLRLRNIDRLILVWLYRLFPALVGAFIIVEPETLLRWHRRGFASIGAGSLAGAGAGLGSIANSEH